MGEQQAAMGRQAQQARPGQQIVVYSTAWCGDCRRAKRIFALLGVRFQEIDIERDAAALAFVEHLNGGMRSVPVILFPDGTRLVEPSSWQLETTLRKHLAE